MSRWQYWEIAHWDPACGALLFERMVKQLFGQGDPSPAQIEKGEEELRRYGAVLNDCLADRPFLCGKNLSLADFSVGAWLNYAERAQYPLSGFPEIRRWHGRLMEIPAWRGSIVAPPF